MTITEADRRHADLMAGFFSQLACVLNPTQLLLDLARDGLRRMPGEAIPIGNSPL